MSRLTNLQVRLLMPPPAPTTARRQRGQATAEYALVLLAAAAIAMLVVAWATKSGIVGKLFDLVFDNVIKRFIK